MQRFGDGRGDSPGGQGGAGGPLSGNPLFAEEMVNRLLEAGAEGIQLARVDAASAALAGTRTLSRISSAVDDARMPSLSSFLPTVKPGCPRSTTKAVMPR